MKLKLIKDCIKITSPVLFGYITLSIAFGLIATESYPWWLAPVMSLFMYAGAAQFILIGLVASMAPLSVIFITMALVNLRHIFYGLSLISRFKNCGKWKTYLMFSLTDETYSILTSIDKSEIPPDISAGTFYGTIALLNHLYWVLGTLIGAILGKIIPFDLTGADFALTALFAVLTIEQIFKTKDLIPVITGIISSSGAIVLWRLGIIKDSSNILLITLCIGMACLFLIKGKKGIK